MDQNLLDQLINKSEGKYRLVCLYQKRLRELLRGLPPLVEAKSDSGFFDIINREILAEKVQLLTGADADKYRKELAAKEELEVPLLEAKAKREAEARREAEAAANAQAAADAMATPIVGEVPVGSPGESFYGEASAIPHPTAPSADSGVDASVQSAASAFTEASPAAADVAPTAHVELDLPVPATTAEADVPSHEIPAATASPAEPRIEPAAFQVEAPASVVETIMPADVVPTPVVAEPYLEPAVPEQAATPAGSESSEQTHGIAP